MALAPKDQWGFRLGEPSSNKCRNCPHTYGEHDNDDCKHCGLENCYAEQTYIPASRIAAYDDRLIATLSTEPVCVCDMSLGRWGMHNKLCQWVAWNAARKVVPKIKVAAKTEGVGVVGIDYETPASNPLTRFTLKPGQLLKSSTIHELNNKHPDWTIWPIDGRTGTTRCPNVCGNLRKDVSTNPTSIRACTHCKLIFLDCM